MPNKLGRPLKPEAERLTSITVRITPAQREFLEKFLTRSRRSKWFRGQIDEAMRRVAKSQKM